MIRQFLKNAINLTGLEIKRALKSDPDIGLYEAIYAKESVENRRFYNISAGGHFDFGCGIHHPCWTNIDVMKPWPHKNEYDPRLDIAHDLLLQQPIPLESNTAELVYSRISIEHITDEAALFMFKEVKRILKPKGVFRIVTPNIDLDYRAFMTNDKRYYYWFDNQPEVSIEQAFLIHFAAHASPLTLNTAPDKISDEQFRNLFKTMTFEEAMNFCTSKCRIDVQTKMREFHINWWNAKKLERMLGLAGFKSMYISAPLQSISPVLRNEYFFDNVYNKVMLYMEVINT